MLLKKKRKKLEIVNRAPLELPPSRTFLQFEGHLEIDCDLKNNKGDGYIKGNLQFSMCH